MSSSTTPVRHVLVRLDGLARWLADGPGQAGLSAARLADDGDLIEPLPGAGGAAFVADVPDTEQLALALRAALEQYPTALPLVACALDATGGTAICHAVRDGVLGERLDCTVVPRSVDVFDRVRGVFESDVLRGRTVAVLGVGSGGSMIARDLAMSGVGKFVLVDHDRMEIGNVSRHACDLADAGRLKVNAVGDLLARRNPDAEVVAVPEHISGGTLGGLARILQQEGVDLVVGATDNRQSRLLVNRLCLQAGLPGLFAGVFRRAYGGQVLRVLPGLSPCYQCFVSILPAMAEEREVSSQEDAAAVAYSDRPVAVEPGLASDIAPVALMVVKLAILELLPLPTTLDSLRKDLVAPLYLWLNRREAGTDYEGLHPLETGVDGLTVQRWYGVDLPRNPSCPTCGDTVTLVR